MELNLVEAVVFSFFKVLKNYLRERVRACEPREEQRGRGSLKQTLR